MQRVLVIHGPNLNLLGSRQPQIYGTTTLGEIEQMLETWGQMHGWDVSSMQSNHEGEIIDRIHEERSKATFIVINPGAYTHTSYAIRDAIEAVEIPTIEVHLSNIHAREPFRGMSVLAPVCRGQISGLGAWSYVAALGAGAHLFGEQEDP